MTTEPTLTALRESLLRNAVPDDHTYATVFPWTVLDLLDRLARAEAAVPDDGCMTCGHKAEHHWKRDHGRRWYCDCEGYGPAGLCGCAWLAARPAR